MMVMHDAEVSSVRVGGKRNEVDQIMAQLPPDKVQALRVVRSARKAVSASTSASTGTSDTSAAGGASCSGLEHSDLETPGNAPRDTTIAPRDNDSETLHIGKAEEVLSKLGKDWTGKVLAAPKWQDKKDMLDKLLSVTSGPGRRLAVGDYSEVLPSSRLIERSSAIVEPARVTLPFLNACA
jgi:hypothetical protein